MASGAEVAARAQAELKEIGGKCGNNNKYTHWYSDNVENIGYNFWWCAAFVTYVVRQCGVPTDVVPNYASCSVCIKWARSNGRLRTKAQVKSGEYTPKPGDIFLREGHTGIIVSVSAGSFTTVEGNTGGVSNCRTVGSHSFSFDSQYYEYIFEPDYPDKPQTILTAAVDGAESFMYSENTYSDAGENKEATVVWNNRVRENINSVMQNAAAIPPCGELTLYAGGSDITKIAGGLSWQSNIYELAVTLSFEVAKTDAAYLSDLMYTPVVGDIIQMVGDEEIFRGIIVSVDDGDADVNKYSAVDLGWYLNKTSQTYQFRNIFAEDAIREVCADLSVNVVTLPELSQKIDRIYFDKTVSDILTDILGQCEGNFNYDFVPEGLRIYMVGELAVAPTFHIAGNIPPADSADYRGSVSHSLSMEEMINSVKITTEKDNVYTDVMVLQDRELIDRYGFLQKIVKIDPEKENAETVAKRELEQSAKMTETYGFEILEDVSGIVRAGEVYAVDGQSYVIESAAHSFDDGWLRCKVELRRIT